MAKSRSVLVLFLILLIHSGNAHAQWSTDPKVNNAVCTAAGDQQSPTLCGDGAGGAIITWQDGRNGYPDIYAQRINTSGAVLWNADGVAICTAAGNQERPAICSDGAGGAIITWYDNRSNSTNGHVAIYAQRVSASGAVQWSANGMVIGTSADNHTNPTGPEILIVSDGVGGAIIMWGDYRNVENGDVTIYAQRVNASGVLQWTANGVAIGTTASASYNFAVTSDGAGGEIIMWVVEAPAHIYAQRINASGAVQWTANGVAISTSANANASNHMKPAICSDGVGGAIITWNDDRSGVSNDIYAQRVSASGVVQWTANDVAICTAANHQLSPIIASDGGGGAIITWYDNRSGNTLIYAQRINASGAVLWNADGVMIGNSAVDQEGLTICSDSSGGTIITCVINGLAINAQRINASGVVQWGTNGVGISSSTGNQNPKIPTIVSDGARGAIITWADHRGGISYDIYAQRVNANGTLGDVMSQPWVLQTSPLGSKALGRIQFVSSTEGWISEGYGSLLHTTNAGTDWSVITPFPNDTVVSMSDPAVTMWWVNQAHGWKMNILGTSGSDAHGAVIHKTTDGGRTWGKKVLSTAAGDMGVQVQFVDENVGWASIYHVPIGNMTLLRSTDGGNNWSPMSDTAGIFYFVDANSGWAIGAQKIYHTTNGGKNWPVQYTGTTPGSFLNIQFTDLNNGWVIGDSSKILRTTDGGSNWIPITNAGLGSATKSKGLFFLNANVGWIGSKTQVISGTSGIILYTTNGGSSWTTQLFPGSSSDNVWSIFFWDATNGWFTSDAGKIGHATAGGATGVEKVKNSIPSGYSLSQNYPNPFNPTTNISFTLLSTSFVTLKIFDVIGREVATLVSEELSAGHHARQWNANTTASGIYFYRLQAGSFIETRKLVLLR
jgi:photosystem II stability/assembly factor-like uncharacterized protein